jgi:hypothetical protein
MEKKEQKSPHGWFIILLIVFTLCIFLLTMVYTMEQENVMVVRKMKKEHTTDLLLTKNNNPGKKPLMLLTTTPTTTSLPPAAVKIQRGGKTLYRHDKTDLVNESMKRHLHSLPVVVDVVKKADDVEITAYSEETVLLSLHGYEISNFSVGKNFYIYDCNIASTPDYLVATILMELPEIKVEFKDHPKYSQYCPTINPYIHVVELVYMWGYDKETMETDDFMTLSSLKIFMVSWEDNLYRKSYEQVKNSPLYKVNVPIPLNLKKEELYDFLTKSNIFNNVAMTFTPPVTLQSIQNNTPIS